MWVIEAIEVRFILQIKIKLKNIEIIITIKLFMMTDSEGINPPCSKKDYLYLNCILVDYFKFKLK